MFTFDTSVLRITHTKVLKGSEKLSEDVRAVFNSPGCQLIHTTWSTRGLIIFKEIAYTFFF